MAERLHNSKCTLNRNASDHFRVFYSIEHEFVIEAVGAKPETKNKLF